MRRALVVTPLLAMALGTPSVSHAGHGPSSAMGPATAFFYGGEAPVDALDGYQWIVVEPDHIKNRGALAKTGATVFGYVSIGEINRNAPDHASVDRALFLTDNPDWHSDVVDLTRPEWHHYVIDKRIAPLWADGYRGFFFDTLDSYNRADLDDAGRRAQAAGLTRLIGAVHARFPGVKLILNRGFEVLDGVHHLADAIAFESLYERWSAADKRFSPVPQADRKWLLTQLAKVQEHGLPVIAIDYCPTADRALARRTAKRIADHGFVPWVTDPQLRTVGVGAHEVLPRRILVLHDHDEDVATSRAHRLAGPVLEHLGLVPEYASPKTLPKGPISGRYAGVVAWLSTDVGPGAKAYSAWLTRRFDERVPVALLGLIGFVPDPELLQRIGLVRRGVMGRAPFTIAGADPSIIGFEAPARPGLTGFVPQQTIGQTQSILRVTDADGEPMDAGVIGPWGGFVRWPHVLERGLNDRNRWAIDPFTFLKRALNLSPAPIADVTTENGRRLFMAHIDGDGFPSRAEMPGTPYAASVIYNRILKKRRRPHTVSIIEGEIGPSGLFSRDSPKLERIARAIFRLPEVEIASHTYSHPFDWAGFEAGHDDPKKRMQIPGYAFSLERDIDGSVRYINERLAPAGKKLKVFLWSGNAIVSGPALSRIADLGLVSMNGHGARMTTGEPSLTEVGPLGRRDGDHFQLYAPIANEIPYTAAWQGPYYGFRKVIETLELTESPRRLKPIDVYYHFYSGSKPSALDALERIFDWTDKQETFDIWVSEYATRVDGFLSMQVARSTDGSFILSRLGALRTVRIGRNLGWPDLKRSTNVVGVTDAPQGRYVSLGPADTARLYLQPTRSTRLSIESGNASVLRWSAGDDRVRFRLKGHGPVRLTVVAPQRTHCELTGRRARVVAQGESRFELRFRESDTGERTLACR